MQRWTGKTVFNTVCRFSGAFISNYGLSYNKYAHYNVKWWLYAIIFVIRMFMVQDVYK